MSHDPKRTHVHSHAILMDGFQNNKESLAVRAMRQGREKIKMMEDVWLS